MTAQISASQVKQLREATQAGMMDCKKALAETDGDFDAAVKLLREKGIAKAGKLGDRETTEGRVGYAGNERLAALVLVGCNTDFVARNDEFGHFVQDVAHHVHDNRSESVEQLMGETWKGGGTVEEARTEASSSTGENVTIEKIALFAPAEPGVVGHYIHGTGIGVLVEMHGPAHDDVLKAANEVAMHVAAANPQYLTRDEVPQDAIDAERDIYMKQVEDKPEQIRGKIADGKLDKWFGEVALLEQQWIFGKDRLGKDVTIQQYLDTVTEEAGAQVSIRRFVRFAVKG